MDSHVGAMLGADGPESGRLNGASELGYTVPNRRSLARFGMHNKFNAFYKHSVKNTIFSPRFIYAKRISQNKGLQMISLGALIIASRTNVELIPGQRNVSNFHYITSGPQSTE
jgi:hypothetical protein